MLEASAVDFKNALKREQSTQLTSQLLLDFGSQLSTTGWQADTINNLLHSICTHTAAKNGFIAVQDNNVLSVLAKKGFSYPVGARIPLIGHLANLLKSPSNSQIIDTPAPQCWPGADPNSCQNWLISIVYQQRAYGVIGLHDTNLHQTTIPTTLLLGLSGLIGCAINSNKEVSVLSVNLQVLDKLTPREREIFTLLPAGLSNQELAKKLGIAPGTVKIHIERILSKLNLKDRTQAAIKAVEMGYRSGL